MNPTQTITSLDLAAARHFVRLAAERRSVRSFEPGRQINRETLELICDAGRWAPSGANTQPWELCVVHERNQLDAVAAVFAAQADRLNKHCQGFPHVHKKHWVHDAVAIIVLFADPRWQAAYPTATDPAVDAAEYGPNRTNIFLVSLGAAAQNMHLAAAALGLSTAWLSGGGEPTTATQLRAALDVPEPFVPYATIPIGWPHRRSDSRWRRPLGEVIHWDRLDADQLRTQEDVDRYIRRERRDSIYRDATQRAAALRTTADEQAHGTSGC
ncbi:MAG: nitroreductase family protein [Acidimicrobiia bacterium]